MSRPAIDRAVVASKNPDKITELEALLIRHGLVGEVVRGLDWPDVVEDAPTLEGNALLKARQVAASTGLPAIADDTGLEVDAIIRRRNGEWIAAEIKLGGRAAVDAAAASLRRLRDRVDPAQVGEPRRLVVITATGFAYERTDGVAAVPVTRLSP